MYLYLVLTGQFGALTARLWRYSHVVAAHTRMGADLLLGRKHSGNWEFLRGLWRAVAPLMAPWCADREVPTCANLNFYGDSGSRVRWHSDNEGLFGKHEGIQTHCVNEFLEPLRFSNGNLGQVWTVTLALPGCTMETSWSWMVVVRMSIFTVRNPCRRENG